MKTNEKETEEDISKLPDDILINILSRLTIKEAAKTSVLSSKWRYLWTFFTGSLDFDDIVDMREYVMMSLDSTTGYNYSTAYPIRRQRVLGCINRVLGSLEAQALEGLKICLPINPRCDVNNWVNFAIQKRVQRLELDFHGPKRRDGYIFNFPSHFDIRSSFGSLTSLRLTMVNLSKEALENLLRHCPFLELLSLGWIFCLTSILVSGPSLKLKHLQLKGLRKLKDLEIDAANLESFEYSGQDLNVSLKHVPSLVQMSMGGRCCESFVNNSHQFPSLPLGQLRTLKLELRTATVPEDVLCSIPKLPNLEHLELAFFILENRFLACAAFLKSCPLLHKLTLLKSSDLSCPHKRKIYEHNPHLSLKVAEFVGFEWHTADVEFLMDLHENATTLEKVIIDNCRSHYLGSPKELLYRNSSKYQSARTRAMELASIFPQLKFEIS